MFAAVTGKNEHTCCAGIVAEFHIAGVVTYCIGAGNINAIVFNGLVDKTGFRFDTLAVIASCVAAAVYLLYGNCVCFERRHNMSVDRVYLLSGHLAQADAGLIGNDKKEEFLLKKLQSFKGKGIKNDLLCAADMTSVFDYGAVAVEEHGPVFFVKIHGFFFQ